MTEIKYSKNVLWLKPFVEATKNLVDLSKIRSIRGYRVPVNRNPACDGVTNYYSEKNHRISIRIWEAPEDKHLRSRYEDILITLGHEISHIVHWEHNSDHFKLLGQLMVRFARIIKKENIIDTSARFSSELMNKHIEKKEKAEGELA